MQLENKGILVTGGASGLGAACVRLLTQAGAKATIVDMNPETGAALAEELGSSAQFVKTDVTNEADVEAAIKAAIDKFWALHVVTNYDGRGVEEKVMDKNGRDSHASSSK